MANFLQISIPSNFSSLCLSNTKQILFPPTESCPWQTSSKPVRTHEVSGFQPFLALHLLSRQVLPWSTSSTCWSRCWALKDPMRCKGFRIKHNVFQLYHVASTAQFPLGCQYILTTPLSFMQSLSVGENENTRIVSISNFSLGQTHPTLFLLLFVSSPPFPIMHPLTALRQPCGEAGSTYKRCAVFTLFNFKWFWTHLKSSIC